jgi:hypothetical protein
VNIGRAKEQRNVAGHKPRSSSRDGVRRKIPYADAFEVELASDSADHVLLTADFDVKPAACDVKIEFLRGN